jgi:rod shape-determining protein MreB and related proteins
MGILRNARRAAAGGIAIDLGTARTRILVRGLGIVADEPTQVAYAASGEPIAAGHDARVAAAEGRGRLSSPVRGGVVRDPVACVHMLQLLLRKSGTTRVASRDVTLSLPATAQGPDASVVAAVVGSATGGRVVPVESGLAACIGAGVDIVHGGPRLVCDIGASLTEMAAVADGRVIASVATRLGLGDYDTHPDQAQRRVEQLLRRTLDRLPDRTAGDAAATSLLLVGGGALRSDLTARLGATCQMPVLVPDRPRDVVAHGLASCMTGPLVAA